MVWAPHGHGEAVDALRRLTNIVLVDTQDDPEPREAFQRAHDLAGSAYVVDLAWLRSTPWRERVAASFDPPPLRRALGSLTKVQVRHRHDSTASGVLFCGWLASRLGWRTEQLAHQRRPAGGPRPGPARRGRRRAPAGPDGRARARRRDARDGLGRRRSRSTAGRAGCAPCGGRADGGEHAWTVMGASRGEAGILGEGVRQALLRDPTYKPALEAARGCWSDATVRIVDDPASEVADLLVDIACAGGHVALAGGSTPRRAYQLVADQGARSRHQRRHAVAGRRAARAGRRRALQPADGAAVAGGAAAGGAPPARDAGRHAARPRRRGRRLRGAAARAPRPPPAARPRRCSASGPTPTRPRSSRASRPCRRTTGSSPGCRNRGSSRSSRA